MPSSTACSSAAEGSATAAGAGVPRASRVRRLTAGWYAAREPPWGLRLLAGAFGAAVALRRAAYRHRLLAAQRCARPVIVAGNLTVGGTGKTPLVMWLCAELRALGAQPGIALRGFGARAAHERAARLVAPDSEVREVGDEAVMLARRTGVPVAVGRDRVQAARRLLAEGVEVIVADDGLQHLRLARDLELVVIDARRGLGNGHLLPAGPLREPAARLAEADAIVLNVSEGWPLPPSTAAAATTAATLATLAGLPGMARLAHGPIGAIRKPMLAMHMVGTQLRPLEGEGPSVPLASFAGRAVHAIAGVGHPERFFDLLRAAGLAPIAHAFPDHHRYQEGELRFADGLPLLMTEKDAVKCRRLGLTGAWYLPVTAELAEPHAAWLRRRLRGLLTGTAGREPPGE